MQDKDILNELKRKRQEHFNQIAKLDRAISVFEESSVQEPGKKRKFLQETQCKTCKKKIQVYRIRKVGNWCHDHRPSVVARAASRTSPKLIEDKMKEIKKGVTLLKGDAVSAQKK